MCNCGISDIVVVDAIVGVGRWNNIYGIVNVIVLNRF